MKNTSLGGPFDGQEKYGIVDSEGEEGGVEKYEGLYPGLILITPHEIGGSNSFELFDNDDNDDDGWIVDHHGTYYELGTNKDVPIGSNQKILLIGEYEERGIWLCIYYEDCNEQFIKKDSKLSGGKRIRISEDELRSWQEIRANEDKESALILEKSTNLINYYQTEFADKAEKILKPKKLQAKRKKTAPSEEDKNNSREAAE